MSSASTLRSLPTPYGNPEAAKDGVRVALSTDGRFGAFLVAPSTESARPSDEARLAPRLGSGGWKVASAYSGPVGFSAALGTKVNESSVYAGGVLHLEKTGRYTLLAGANDSLSVYIDGARVYTHDEVRAQRDDDDLIPLDLKAGDHSVVFALHQPHPRVHGWSLHARLLDDALESPKGASWILPGAGTDVAASLAAAMSSVHFDRNVTPDGYHLVLTVRFTEGAPRDLPLSVHARLGNAARTLFDVNAGDVAPGERGMPDFVVTLPHVAGTEVEDDDFTLHVDAAGRSLDLPFHPRKRVREAIAHADRALGPSPSPGTDGGMEASQEVVRDSPRDPSVKYLRDRLFGFVARGDGDVDAQLDDARELDGLATALDEGKADPWAGRKGPMRRAYISPLDGKPSEFALYVPADFNPARKYPLIVALHGMNGRPMEMLMWLFGHDDPNRDAYWEDRHPRHALERLGAIVVAPDGHANTMYRELGEEDVMQVTKWALSHYPIDESRITITGPSMGGIGTAACALHHPDRFAAAEPLCGYHSYFVRGDIGGHWMRKWEQFIAEERSNVMWAENGQYLPMYIVHGTKDLPEENSGVLIDRYDELHYSVKHEHPELGHNVWQPTYEDLKGAEWLLDHQRPLHPRALRFKTAGTRWADDAWLHVREMSASSGWGEVFARIEKDNRIHTVIHGIDALALDRDPERIDDAAPVTVYVDGTRSGSLTFPAGEPIELHREGDLWKNGRAVHSGIYKHGTVTGPLRDVLHEPLLFVYGASDPAQTRANEEAARGWAKVHPGIRVDYPVMSDVEFQAHGEALANDRALFLVGNAKSNSLLRELEPSLPIRVDGDDILVGNTRIAPTDGHADRSQLGAAFIYPNPRRPDRYIVVVEGVGPLGTWRSLSLPDMLPDYVVYDAGVAPARGMLALGAGTLRAGGYFSNDWTVPVAAR